MQVARAEVSGGDILLTVFAESAAEFDDAKVAMMDAIDAEGDFRLIRVTTKRHGEGRTLQARMEREPR